MVTYSCELCGFSSVYSTRYRDHCMTRKHLRNLDKFEKDKNMVCQKKNQGNNAQMNPFESHLNPFESQMNPIESPKNEPKVISLYFFA